MRSRPNTHRRQPGHGGRRRSGGRPPAPSRIATLEIEAMGRGGDGVAHDGDGEAIHVAFGLPGERVTAEVSGRRGVAATIETPSTQRREPRCRHHGGPGRDAACGSCALQHWTHDAYAQWKRGLLVSALSREGLEVAVDPLVPCAWGARRRLVLSARATAGGVLLGFNEARSERIVDMAECPVAHPVLVTHLGPVRELLSRLLAPAARARVSMLLTETGIDLRIDPETAGAPPLAPASLPGDVVRVSWGEEVLLESAAPRLDFGAVAVSPPPGAFVQAVEAAERAMADLVTDHLADCRHVADLYAGSGTFSLRLASRSSVHAVEGEAAPLAALDRAWRNGSRLRAVTTERRDLVRRPLLAAELDGRDGPGSKPFDGIVLDPPRAGAERQVREIAASRTPRVAMVSCNPVTLARDLAILSGGGYRPVRCVPIDQFLYTPHLEAVCLLTREN